MDWSIGQMFDFAIPLLERLPTVRAILGFTLVFFLPGFTWTLVFFEKLKVIERIALSFGLSIAVVTLSIIALNLLIGMRITGTNSLLTIVVITIIPIVFYYLKKLTNGRSSTEA